MDVVIGHMYLHTLYPNSYYKYEFCPRFNSKRWANQIHDPNAFVFPPPLPASPQTSPQQVKNMTNHGDNEPTSDLKNTTCFRKGLKFPVGFQMCVESERFFFFFCFIMTQLE